MNAEEIPHEETIKRLQAEIETLRARVKELENAQTKPVQEEAPRAKRNGKAKAESGKGDDLGAGS